MLFIILFQIFISEIMVNPNGSEYHNEFIEIYNGTDSEIDLVSLTISDGSGIDGVINPNGSTRLKPKEYGLIMDPSYTTSELYYDSLISDIPVVFFIDNNSFGHNGFSNSSPELITISYDGVIVDSIRTFVQIHGGYSIERRISHDLSWMESVVLNGTPGKVNSVDVFIEPWDISISNERQRGFDLHFKKKIRYDYPLVYDIYVRRKTPFRYETVVSESVTITGLDEMTIPIIVEDPLINQRMYNVVVLNESGQTIFTSDYELWQDIDYFPLLISGIIVDNPQVIVFKNMCTTSIYIDTLVLRSSGNFKQIPINQFLASENELKISKHDEFIDGIFDPNIPYLYSKNMILRIGYKHFSDSLEYHIDPFEYNMEYLSLIPDKLYDYNHQSEWLINPEKNITFAERHDEMIKVPDKPINLNIESAVFELVYRDFDVLRCVIFDRNGKKIRTLTGPTYYALGKWSWDGKTDHSTGVKSGVYILYVEARKIKDGKKRRFKKPFIVYR